jgi:hypothetical protein
MANGLMTTKAGTALSMISLLGALIAPLASAAEVVPHKARYELALESLSVEGFPLEASGAMAVRITRDCQKWERLQEMQFSVGVEGGEPINLHMLIRGLEGLDERRMEFTGWQRNEGGDRSSLKGAVAMNGDGYGGTARFQQPVKTDWDLPSPTKLPMAAMNELLDALGRGQTDAQSISFEVLGISEVTRIGPGQAVNYKKIKTDDISLVEGKSWLVDRAVYFEAIAMNEPFLIETLQIHANGVVSKFWHDYHTMVLSGELVALEKISIPDC